VVLDVVKLQMRISMDVVSANEKQLLVKESNLQFKAVSHKELRLRLLYALHCSHLLKRSSPCT
jgi:hypothetical protein